MEISSFFAVKLKSLHGSVLSYNPHGPSVVWLEDFDRVTAQRDTLNARLTAADEHNDRLIAAINKVRETVCLPASIEAILISALDRKEKN